MKRIKFLLIGIAFCAISAAGYNVYTNATMTEEERLMQANLEALSSDESSGNILLKFDGYTVVYCKVKCSQCGTTWDTFQTMGPASASIRTCSCGSSTFVSY